MLLLAVTPDEFRIFSPTAASESGQEISRMFTKEVQGENGLPLLNHPRHSKKTECFPITNEGEESSRRRLWYFNVHSVMRGARSVGRSR
jgi:hypothetical protein